MLKRFCSAPVGDQRATLLAIVARWSPIVDSPSQLVTRLAFRRTLLRRA